MDGKKCATRDANIGGMQKSGLEVRCELHKRVTSKMPVGSRAPCVRLTRRDRCLAIEKGWSWEGARVRPEQCRGRQGRLSMKRLDATRRGGTGSTVSSPAGEGRGVVSQRGRHGNTDCYLAIPVRAAGLQVGEKGHCSGQARAGWQLECPGGEIWSS